MRDSDPGVRIVFVQRHNSDLNSVLTVQATGCNFQYGPISWCSLGFNLSVRMLLRLLAKCTHDRATASVNCENSEVSFVMKYCPTSTVVRNPASVQNLLNLSFCDNF